MPIVPGARVIADLAMRANCYRVHVATLLICWVLTPCSIGTVYRTTPKIAANASVLPASGARLHHSPRWLSPSSARIEHVISYGDLELRQFAACFGALVPPATAVNVDALRLAAVALSRAGPPRCGYWSPIASGKSHAREALLSDRSRRHVYVAPAASDPSARVIALANLADVAAARVTCSWTRPNDVAKFVCCDTYAVLSVWLCATSEHLVVTRVGSKYPILFRDLLGNQPTRGSRLRWYIWSCSLSTVIIFSAPAPKRIVEAPSSSAAFQSDYHGDLRYRRAQGTSQHGERVILASARAVVEPMHTTTVSETTSRNEMVIVKDGPHLNGWSFSRTAPRRLVDTVPPRSVKVGSRGVDEGNCRVLQHAFTRALVGDMALSPARPDPAGPRRPMVQPNDSTHGAVRAVSRADY